MTLIASIIVVAIIALSAIASYSLTVAFAVLAVVLFACGIMYINDSVKSTDATVGYSACLMSVVFCLLSMSWAFRS